MLPSEKRKLLTQISKLYYYGHMTQQEIADTLQITRSKVARLLLEAVNLGIVTVTVRDPYFSPKDAAVLLKNHFRLEHVTIVPSCGKLDDTKTNIGKAASDLLNSKLFDGMKIGISWGSTVGAFVSAFRTNRSWPQACVVQLVGGMYSQALHMDGREQARTLASKLKCRFSVLELPMLVHNPQLRELILQEPETIAHYNLMRNLDIAFVGVGSSNYKESIIYKAQYIDENEAKDLYATGLCDICGHQISMDGHEPKNLSDRLIGISLEDLAKTPLTIGLCAGSDRTASIISAVRCGYLKGLIIDEIAALSLIREEGLD